MRSFKQPIGDAVDRSWTGETSDTGIGRSAAVISLDSISEVEQGLGVEALCPTQCHVKTTCTLKRRNLTDDPSTTASGVSRLRTLIRLVALDSMDNRSTALPNGVYAASPSAMSVAHVPITSIWLPDSYLYRA